MKAYKDRSIISIFLCILVTLAWLPLGELTSSTSSDASAPADNVPVSEEMNVQAVMNATNMPLLDETIAPANSLWVSALKAIFSWLGLMVSTSAYFVYRVVSTVVDFIFGYTLQPFMTLLIPFLVRFTMSVVFPVLLKMYRFIMTPEFQSFLFNCVSLLMLVMTAKLLLLIIGKPLLFFWDIVSYPWRLRL